MRKVIVIAVGLIAILAIAMLARPVRKNVAPTRADTGPEPEARTDPDEPETHGASTESSTATLGPTGGALPPTLIDPALVVSKSLRALTVISDGVRVRTYRVALGRDPIGDKEREGDGRTPEGDFYVCSRNPDSRYHRSLGLSYPNDEDAERGRLQALISKREYADIMRAIGAMKRPPWNTALGGEIMIHGGGTSSDWTDGCIALSDSDAEELFDATPLGTPVRVEP